MESKTATAFAVWLTGPPASGNSALAGALETQLAARGIVAAVLESDLLRPVLTPLPNYGPDERDAFYGQMVFIGELLAGHGIPVIFDATANRRSYRDRARRRFPRFLEVYVDCPLDVCAARDPKGIYRQAREGAALHVPGLQSVYEPPESPDLIVHGDREKPEPAAARVIAKLAEKGFLNRG